MQQRREEERLAREASVAQLFCNVLMVATNLAPYLKRAFYPEDPNSQRDFELPSMGT